MMLFKSITLPLMLISFVVPTHSFCINKVSKENGILPMVNSGYRREAMDLNMSSPSSSSSSSISSSPLGRRDIIKKAGSMLIFSSVLSSSNTAQAKDKEPVALSTVTAAFQAVRDELDVGIVELGVLVDKVDYEGIMEFTKYYDLEFRKAKMVKARRYLTSKEDKEKATSVCNAVTFDLIGMNKFSREGQRNIEQVQKYYGELKEDVLAFLEFEKKIDVTAYIP